MFCDNRSYSTQKSFLSEKKTFPGMNVQDHFYLMLRVLVYITCIIFFVMNSYAIFENYWSNPTIISTQVIKSPNRLLEFPSILMCNESAFRTPVMVTDYSGYKNNTMRLDDFLMDMKFGRDLGKAVLKAQLKSIKGNIQEVLTAFHGTCFLSQERIQVNSMCILVVVFL